nr:homeobox protein 5-like [Dermatophagoides farinae]
MCDEYRHWKHAEKAALRWQQQQRLRMTASHHPHSHQHHQLQPSMGSTREMTSWFSLHPADYTDGPIGYLSKSQNNPLLNNSNKTTRFNLPRYFRTNISNQQQSLNHHDHHHHHQQQPQQLQSSTKLPRTTMTSLPLNGHHRVNSTDRLLDTIFSGTKLSDIEPITNNTIGNNGLNRNQCCHCMNCSQTWFFRNDRHGDWCCQRGYYQPPKRNRLPFGAASSVNTFMRQLRNDPLDSLIDASVETTKNIKQNHHHHHHHHNQQQKRSYKQQHHQRQQQQQQQNHVQSTAAAIRKCFQPLSTKSQSNSTTTTSIVADNKCKILDAVNNHFNGLNNQNCNQLNHYHHQRNNEISSAKIALPKAAKHQQQQQQLHQRNRNRL